MRRKDYPSNAQTVTIVVRGPEPVGASTIGALDSQLGLQLAGRAGPHIPYGMPAVGNKLTGALPAQNPAIRGQAALGQNPINTKAGFNRALPSTHRTPAAEGNDPSPMYGILAGMGPQ